MASLTKNAFACGGLALHLATLVACGDVLQDGRSQGRVPVIGLPGQVANTNTPLPPAGGTSPNATPNCTQLGPAIPAVLSGGTFTSPPAALTLDGNDMPLVAYSVGNGLRLRPMWVGRLTAEGTWTGIGASLADPNGLGQSNGGVSLINNPNGAPAVAWMALSPNAVGHFKVWDGNSWNGIFNSEDFSVSNANWYFTANNHEPRTVTAYRDEGPLVAWSTSYASSGLVTTAAWTGTDWSTLKDLEIPDDVSTQFSLATGAGNTVGLAVNGPFPSVQLLDPNGAWRDTNLRVALDNGTQVAAATDPVLLIQNNGLPLVAWEQTVNGVPSIYVFVSDSNSVWTPLGPPIGSNGLFPPPFVNASHPAMALNPQGLPVLAAEDAQSNQIIVRQWDGASTWRNISGLDPTQAVSAGTGLAAWPVVRVTAQNQVVLAWYSDNAAVRVCKLTP